jgi:hypothetical protein
LIGQPILIYAAQRAELARALERALMRGVCPAIYTEDMFTTFDDAANRAVVRSVTREQLNLVGMAIRAERKTGKNFSEEHGMPPHEQAILYSTSPTMRASAHII